MKYYLIITVIAAFAVVGITTSDLAINDSVLDRMARLKAPELQPQAVAVTVGKGVQRKSFNEALESFEQYAAPGASNIEVTMLGEYGRMLKSVAKKCPQAHNYIASSVTSVMGESISSQQANQWMKQAEQFCY